MLFLNSILTLIHYIYNNMRYKNKIEYYKYYLYIDSIYIMSIVIIIINLNAL